MVRLKVVLVVFTFMCFGLCFNSTMGRLKGDVDEQEYADLVVAIPHWFD